MAKDYFQDILPPSGDEPRRPGVPAPEVHDAHDGSNPIAINMNPPRPVPPPPPEGERSIRHISMPSRTRARPPMNDMRDMPGISGVSPEKGRRSRWWTWIVAGACVVVLAILLLVAMRQTTVTVTPRSHNVTFDQSSQFTAYPAESAASGTLSYTLQISDLEDSEVVPSQGTVHAEDKASGTVTVYNSFQSTPFKLIKNTRFESPDGLIFRTPAEVVIPGKSGSTPGQVTITVVADKAGEQYNIAAAKLTVPGLKSSAAQFAGVYAQSTQPMSGGFIGDKPGVAPGAKEAALSTVRARLESKARGALAQSSDSIIFPDLVRITYVDEPDTVEAGGGVRIHEKAHVEVPVFPTSALASAVYADANGASVTLVPGPNLAASLLNGSSAFGASPLQFSLSGNAQIVWNVDAGELAKALAGKDQSAFQSISTQFPGVQEARARIEPFWKSTFPSDPTDINIVIQAPTN